MIGIDFGGTKVEIALATDVSVVLDSVRLPSHAERGSDQLLKRTGEAAKELFRAARRQGAEVVGCAAVGPGVILPDQVLLAPNLPGWDRVALHDWLNGLLPVDVTGVDNDVRAGALAELRAGALVGVDPGVYLSLGTGVAAALTVAGRVVRGAHGASGEIGYTTLPPHAASEDSLGGAAGLAGAPGVDTAHGPLGADGSSYGLVGADGRAGAGSAGNDDGLAGSDGSGGVAGMGSVARSAGGGGPADADGAVGVRGVDTADGANGPVGAGGPLLEELVGARGIEARASALLGMPVTIESLARRSDPAAVRVIHEVAAALAVALGNLAVVVDPQRIVVGGGVAATLAQIVPMLESRLRQGVPFPPEVVPARFAGDASVRGAIALALDAVADRRARSDRAGEKGDTPCS